MRTLSMMMVMVAAACGGGSKATTTAGPVPPAENACETTPWDTLPDEEVDAACASCADACMEMAARNAALMVEDAEASYLERACALEDGRACLYAAERAGEEDKLLQLHVRGCELLEPEACFHLGHFSESGTLMEENQEAALGYYRKACELGAERRLVEGRAKSRIDEACAKAGMP